MLPHPAGEVPFLAFFSLVYMLAVSFSQAEKRQEDHKLFPQRYLFENYLVGGLDPSLQVSACSWPGLAGSKVIANMLYVTFVTLLCKGLMPIHHSSGLNSSGHNNFLAGWNYSHLVEHLIVKTARYFLMFRSRMRAKATSCCLFSVPLNMEVPQRPLLIVIGRSILHLFFSTIFGNSTTKEMYMQKYLQRT